MESFLFDLKNNVQCSLCNDTLSEPKILPCFHTFCKPCIKRHAELIDEVNIFKCPRCNSQTFLPEPSSIEDLQPSPLRSRILKGLALLEREKVCYVSESHSSASWYCFDCDRSMCDECKKCHSALIQDHRVVRLADLKKEDIQFIITREPACTSHPHHRLELFCEDCDAMICRTCLIHHKDHKTMSLEKFAEIKKAVLSNQLHILEQLRVDDKEKQQQENIANTIKEQGEKARLEVKENTKKLMHMLQENEREMLRQIDAKLDTATTNLNIIYHIPAVKEYTKNVMERGLASEMIDNQGTQCSEKFIFNPIPLSSGIVFVPNQELVQQVNTGLGEIQTYCDQANGTILVKDEPEAEVDSKIREKCLNIKLQEMRITGEFNGVTKVQSVGGIAVNPDNSRIAVTGSFIDVLNTWNNVNPASIFIGQPTLSHVCSDCQVRVFDDNGSHLRTLSQTSGQMTEGSPVNLVPKCIAFLNDVDLAILYHDDQRIRIVNTITGRLVRTLAMKSIVDEEFCYPSAIHVDDDGNIVVCDRDNHRIQVFSRDGHYQYQFGLTTKAIFDPIHATTHDGRFYVSDQYNHVIHVFEKKGDVPTRISTIGGYGSADGQLNTPSGLAIDKDNHLLVCDRGNNRVQEFTLDGRVVGKTVDKIEGPSCITVMNNGQILVSACFISEKKHQILIIQQQ